ncbi:Histone-lysine N-methyltransferase SETMAR [Eumeta japonica]|uniref:Histone-lysine N-methyltransferase SETMAR n=1 Tax=Eumeta variegata TaxID=151549 RepID=A0A4C1VEG9_EUMVA|nr:Histone-lysine N-methyltransferase SETMAR [Eumeta japonica]
MRVVQNWVKRFQSSDFNVRDVPRSGRPVMNKVDANLEKIEQGQHSSYNIAEKLRIDHKTVLTHLKKPGCTEKHDTLVPHDFTERNLMNSVLICDSLLKNNEIELFSKKLIIGDKKWIIYDNNV